MYLHGEPEPTQIYAELADYCRQHDCDWDTYGSGEFLNGFEAEVAHLLGMEQALFMPSGVMAQQIALRIWSERAHWPHVAFHPTSHMEINEHRAYAHLHGLHAKLLGNPQGAITADDLMGCPEPLAAVLVELPMRWLGGLLPGWDALQALKATAQARGLRLHMDGARLWETQPYYGRSYTQICQGFDSVYVSFYKTLGGLSGAMLVGPADFIAEARIWLRRHGGNLYQLHPYVVSAKLNLDKHLNRIPAYVERTRTLAERLSSLEGLAVKPAEPRVNMMHLYLQAPAPALTAARDRIAEENHTWLGNRFFSSDHPQWSYMEVFVGETLLAMEDAAVAGLFEKLLKLARATP